MRAARCRPLGAVLRARAPQCRGIGVDAAHRRTHLQWPFYGSRKLCESLRNEGTVVNRKHMQRLMRLMGLESVAPKPDTSKPHPEHPVFPYLLKNLTISQSNQVWATDITYIPMAHGFAYLV